MEADESLKCRNFNGRRDYTDIDLSLFTILVVNSFAKRIVVKEA